MIDDDDGNCIGLALVLVLQGCCWLAIGLMVGHLLWAP